MHLVHTEYDPTGLIVPTATYGEIAEMADVAIRVGENLEPDVREDPAQVNMLRNVLPSEENGPLTTDYEAGSSGSRAVPESDTFGRPPGPS